MISLKTAVVISLEAAGTPGKFRAVEIACTNNTLEITRYLIRDCPDEMITTSWLKTVWTEAGFSGLNVIAVIPHHFVQYKSVTVPDLPEEQLQAAVQIEIETNGFGAGFRCYPIHYQKNDTMVTVKLALISDDEMDKIWTLLHQAGIRISWFGFHRRGLHNFVNFHRDYRDNAPATQSTTTTVAEVYIDIATNKSELTVIQEEEILFCREFTPGGEELWQEPDNGAIDFCQEIRLSMAAFQTLGFPFAWPETMWGFGPLGTLTELAVVLPQRNALKMIVLQNTTLMGAPPAKNIPELASLIGLGLEGVGWAKMEHFQILCRNQQKRKQQRSYWYRAAGYAFSGLLLLGGLFLGYQAHHEKQRKISVWLNTRAETLLQLSRANRETEDDLAGIRRLEVHRRNKARELELFLALQNQLPEGTLINDVTIEDGVVKDLSGVTPAVSILLQQIKRTPLLKNLLLKGTITVSKDGENFHLEGPIGLLDKSKENLQ